MACLAYEYNYNFKCNTAIEIIKDRLYMYIVIQFPQQHRHFVTHLGADAHIVRVDGIASFVDQVRLIAAPS